MNVTFDVFAFFLGCCGAFAHESLRWIGLRFHARLPAYFRRIHYWLLTSLLILLGGGLASILDPTSVIQALCFGIAAPAILTRLGALGSGEPTLASAPEQASFKPSIGDFLRG